MVRCVAEIDEADLLDAPNVSTITEACKHSSQTKENIMREVVIVSAVRTATGSLAEVFLRYQQWT